jgi:hypothetical protein
VYRRRWFCGEELWPWPPIYTVCCSPTSTSARTK